MSLPLNLEILLQKIRNSKHKNKNNRSYMAQNLKFNAEISYSNNGIIGKETLMNELQISEYSLTASVLETLGSLFSNLFVDFILGLLIGVGAYHYYVISKKGKADTEIVEII